MQNQKQNTNTNLSESVSSKTSLRKKSTSRKKVILLVTLAVLLLIGCVTAAILHAKKTREEDIQKMLDSTTFYDGIYINDIDMSGKTKQEAKTLLTEVETSLQPDITIKAVYKDQTITLTKEDFSFVYNTNEIVDKAYDMARNGDTEARYEKYTDLKQNPEKFSIECDFDYDKLSELAASIAEQIDIAPVNASVSKFTPYAQNMFTYQEGKSGIAVDQEDASEKIADLLRKRESGTVTLKVNEVPCEITASDLTEYTKLISSYSTYSTNGASGNHNIALALSHVNGTVLDPGETFSYLNAIGNPGDPAAGWQKAGVISQGKLIQEYGGGVCQGATTVYGASLRAGLTVVTRYNHAWPSVYEEVGQDATVSYPGTDLLLRNDGEAPVFIWAGMIGANVTVRIYGKPSDEWDSINVYSKTVETIEPKETTYKDDPNLPEGTEEVEIAERTGYRATAWRVYYKDGVQVKSENLPSSYYRPIQGVTLRGTKKVETSKPETSKPETSASESSDPESSAPTTSETTSSEAASSEE